MPPARPVPIEGSGIAVQIVGDARAPRSYGNAIHEAGVPVAADLAPTPARA